MTHIHDDLDTSTTAGGRHRSEFETPPAPAQEWANEGGALADGPAVPRDADDVEQPDAAATTPPDAEDSGAALRAHEIPVPPEHGIARPVI